MLSFIDESELCVKAIYEMANAKYSAMNMQDKDGNLRVKLMACNFLNMATEEYFNIETDTGFTRKSSDSNISMSRLSLYKKSSVEEAMEMDMSEDTSPDNLPDITDDLTLYPPSCYLPHTGGISEHTLVNDGPHKLVFKLTSTNDEDYCFSQSHGIIEPYGYCDIGIGRRDAPPKKNTMIVIYGIARGDFVDAEQAYEKLGAVETVEVPLIGY